MYLMIIKFDASIIYMCVCVCVIYVLEHVF